MIRVRNLGRLGNNLFQFAFGYAASKELGTNFFMDDMGWFHFFKNRTYWQLKNKILYKAFSDLERMPEVDWTSNNVDPRQRMEGLLNKRTYRGYFQSENYFKKYEKDLRQILRFRQKFTMGFDKRYASLLKTPNKLIISYRGGVDFINYKLDPSYYSNAIEIIISKGFIPGAIIVISNVPNEARIALDFLNLIQTPVFLETKEMADDFRWLSISDANILSNSTFAWWAGWLNENSRITVAPRHWPSIGPGFENIYNERWTWI